MKKFDKFSTPRLLIRIDCKKSSCSLLYIISRYFVMKQEITIGIVMIVKRHHYTEKKNGPLLRISTAVCVCIIWPQHQEQKKEKHSQFSMDVTDRWEMHPQKKKRESVVSATADAGIIIIIIIIRGPSLYLLRVQYRKEIR